MTAEERKQRDRLAARRRWEKFRAAHPEHMAAYRKRWAALNPDREREYGRVQRAKMRDDPRRRALYKARQERYRLKRNALLRQRYRDDLAFVELNRARQRRYKQRTYAATYVPEGKRKCTLCRQPGHNRVRCGRVPVASLCHDSVHTLLGGGGAPSVEGSRSCPPASPPPAEQVRPSVGPARVAELRALIASGRYVPFAELRRQIAEASFATLPSLWQSAPRYDWRTVARRKNRRAPPTAEELAARREEARIRMRLARERARAAPAEASP